MYDFGPRTGGCGWLDFLNHCYISGSRTINHNCLGRSKAEDILIAISTHTVEQLRTRTFWLRVLESSGETTTRSTEQPTRALQMDMRLLHTAHGRAQPPCAFLTEMSPPTPPLLRRCFCSCIINNCTARTRTTMTHIAYKDSKPRRGQ